MSDSTLQLTKNLREAIAAGHPWIYDRALRPPARSPASGATVTVTDRTGEVAVGYYDPTSPIRVRVLAPAPQGLQQGWAAERARRAAAMRAADPRLAATDARRLVHGENDFLPGLVIDDYAGVAVVACDGEAAEAFWTPRLDQVLEGCRTGGASIDRIHLRGGRRGARAGRGGDDVVMIEEHGARFEVDLQRGQKTGFFLDQRDNRRLVGELAAGTTVLNLFCYTGGFSVHAALGGAARVTSVDIAAPAVEAARRNFVHNQLDPAGHDFVAGDAFEMLEGAIRAGRDYDLVIVDPPSFAPSERTRGRALSAYRRLNARALAVVAPGGLMVTCSCSSHVSTADLLGVLAAAAADAGRRVRVTDIRGAGSDHPVLPAFPEGRYLDVLVAAVD